MDGQFPRSWIVWLVACVGSFWLVGCSPVTASQPLASSQQASIATSTDRPGVTTTDTIESIARTATVAIPHSTDSTPTLTLLVPPVIPELTLTPTITPTRISVPTEDMVSAEYAVAWSTPVGWPEISEQLPADDQTLYRRVWASRVDGAAIFSDSPPDFANGLMLMTLKVEPEEATPFPPPDSTPQETYWGQRRVVHTYERTRVEATPFSLRLGLAVVRSPYRYDFMLDCLIPPDGDVAYQEALCRDVWDKVTFPFGLCARPLTISESEPWQQVSDAYHGYSVEVPGHWLFMPGVTADHLQFSNDPEVYNTPHACPWPNGVIGLRLEAAPGVNFSPYQDGTGPELEGFTEITVDDKPAWIRKVRGGEPAAPDSSPDLLHLSVYIQGPQNWYLLSLRCLPPTGADAASRDTYHAQCEETFNQILERFQVLSPR